MSGWPRNGMSGWPKSRSQAAWGLVAVLASGLCVGAGVFLGSWLSRVPQPPATLFPETLLHANATHSAKTMAIATGWVDEDVEGLFILDYLTGELQCFVLNPRFPQTPLSIFKANVMGDLQVQTGKEPAYMMVTGQTTFQRGTGAAQPGGSVVYVADGNTGHFAVYGLAWQRTLARAGQAQIGVLQLLGGGKARQLELRE